MISGVKTKELKKIKDNRGFLSEVMRKDWGVVIDEITQVNLSRSFPGVIRAWHRHERGQIDYMIVLEGTVKICVYNEKTKELNEFLTKNGDMRIVRIPGKYWHGYKVLGKKPALMMYLVNKMYNYKKPDELRMDHDDARVSPKKIDGTIKKTNLKKRWTW